MSEKINFKEFINRLEDKHGFSIIPISKYIGWSKPIDLECKICGYKWTTNEARSAIRRGCPGCSYKHRSMIVSGKRRKTEEQFRMELFQTHPNLLPNDNYINNHTKYYCVCKVHNIDVYKTPCKLIAEKQGCPLCDAEKNPYSMRYTDELFKQIAYSINPSIEILSKFKSIKDKIHVRCKIDGYEWFPVSETLVRSKNPNGCPRCARNERIDTEQYISLLSSINPDLELISGYKNAATKVHYKCKKCKHDFWATPNKIQQGQECVFCKESKGEKEISRFLDACNIDYIFQHSYDDLRGMGGNHYLMTSMFHLLIYLLNTKVFNIMNRLNFGVEKNNLKDNKNTTKGNVITPSFTITIY